ncbi:unnamed protein product [Amoebophrya sp. A25]|nr:unnamed protein product [Amoebophrya sp. A25]CAD7948446.1 unnamed protein product [Amoebophrya sp. A25]|eukprot:GSA25T00026345001.1
MQEAAALIDYEKLALLWAQFLVPVIITMLAPAFSRTDLLDRMVQHLPKPAERVIRQDSYSQLMKSLCTTVRSTYLIAK